MALRMPISRVRSVTVTSMMFMIPMPPTSREMAATAPSSTVSTWCVSLLLWMRLAWFSTRNGWVAVLVMPCCWSRIVVTSPWASSITLLEARLHRDAVQARSGR